MDLGEVLTWPETRRAVLFVTSRLVDLCIFPRRDEDAVAALQRCGLSMPNTLAPKGSPVRICPVR